jgi:hypothetical protein
MDQKIEVSAEFDVSLGEMKIKKLKLKIGEQEILLDKEQARHLLDVVNGKEGVANFYRKNDYTPYSVFHFSNEGKKINLASIEEGGIYTS